MAKIEQTGGTGGSFQGYDVISARIDLSLGPTPDISQVVVAMGTRFPPLPVPDPGLEFAALGKGGARVGSLLTETSPDDSARTVTGSSSVRLVPAGEFAAAEAIPGEQWEVLWPYMLVDQVVLQDPGKADPDIDGYNVEEEGTKFLTLTLKDARALWPTHGKYLEQHEWNRRQADGSIRPRTGVFRDGAYVEASVKDIVEYICARLPGPPRKGGSGTQVARIPERWKTDVVEISDWPQGIGAYDALNRLLALRPARVAYNPGDGSVGFWLPGEGRVGHNETLTAWSNEAPLPEEDKHTDQIEHGLGWSPGYLVTIGQHKVASVALPAMPVVFPNRRLLGSEVDPDLNLPGAGPDDDPGLGGEPAYLYDWWASALRGDEVENRQAALRLTEQALTNATTPGEGTRLQVQALAQRAALTALQSKPVELTLRDYLYLHRLILRPDIYLSPNARISRRTLAIVRRDALKKWMLEGTVPIQGEDDGARNLHLLPIEDRGSLDTTGRRRLPKAQTYRWATTRTPIGGRANNLSTLGAVEPRARHEALDAAHDVATLIDLIGVAMSSKTVAQSRLDQIGLDLQITGRVSVNPSALQLGGTDRGKVAEVVRDNESRFMAAKRGLVRAVIRDRATSNAIHEAGYTPGQFVGRLAGEGLKALMPQLKADAAGYKSLASAYKQRLDVLARSGALTSETPWTLDFGVQVAEALLKAGKDLKGNSGLRKSAENIPAVVAAIKIVGSAASRVREFNRRAAAREPLADIQRGGADAAVFNMAQHLRNDPQLDDGGLRLVDRDRGIWESQDPIGHVDAVNVPDAAGRTIVPRLVTLVFGARMKPVTRSEVNERPSTGGTSRPGFDDYARALLKLRMHPGATFRAGRPLHRLLDDARIRTPPQIDALTTGQDLGYTRYAFRRPPQPQTQGPITVSQSPDFVALTDLPADQGAPIQTPELQELIQLDGTSNELSLLAPARAAAAAKFAGVEPFVKGRQTTYLRPFAVALNGVVSGVRWETQPDGVGWTTQVVQGLPARPFQYQAKSQARRSPRPEAKRAKRPEDRIPD